MMLTIAAIVLVSLFRSACLGGLRAPLKLHEVLLAGMWLGIAAWVTGALLQAWVPMWVMLIVGVATTAVAAALRPKLSVYAQPIADVLAIALLGALSVVPVNSGLVLAAGLAFAGAGLVFDQITKRFPPRLLPVLQAMPALVLIALAVQVRQPGNFGIRLLEEEPLFPLRLALAIPASGLRLPLDPGIAAWLFETPSDEPRGTAIVLHGNHRYGSQQPSSMVLRGALIRAGYDVVSVDHPGFGGSSTPSKNANWQAWDPALGPMQALRYLQHSKDAQLAETIVVGHSMGVDVALKLLADGARVQAAYLWGGALDRPDGPHWLSGFHRERNLPCCVPGPTMDKIRNEFYGGGDRFAAALPPDHAPLHYVRFGIEHEDVTRDREPLYAAIPEPKKVCDFENVSHYFNSLAVRGFTLLDTRTIQRTAEIFEAGDRAEEICGR